MVQVMVRSDEVTSCHVMATNPMSANLSSPYAVTLSHISIEVPNEEDLVSVGDLMKEQDHLVMVEGVLSLWV